MRSLQDSTRKRRGSRGEINDDGDEKELLAPEPVGQPAKEHGAENRARKIGAAGKAMSEFCEMKLLALLERARQRARKRHFEPVEDPGDAKSDETTRV